MYLGLYVRYSCQIFIKIEFSRHIFENSQISNFTKIRPLEAELFHVDGHRRTDRHSDRQDIQAERHSDSRTERQTDTTKLTVTFRNFVNAPN
jgi:hypothetical protein